MKPVILPLDGGLNSAHNIIRLTQLMSSPGIRDVVGMVKINDGNFKADMSAPSTIDALRSVGNFTNTSFGIFNDLKTGDVSGTLRNISNCFGAASSPEILTVNSLIATKGFLEFKNHLPFTQVALFSVPTDMTVEECKHKYGGMTPAEKIFSDLEFYLEEWEKIVKEEEIVQNDKFRVPFSLVVCSPRELDYLNEKGMGEYFDFLCPGIRDHWMKKDHQERTTGVLEALEKKAKWVVMFTQLIKGNPDAGISPEESQERTLQEIMKFKG